MGHIIKRSGLKSAKERRIFSDLSTLQLTDTLEFGQISGRNGQIHIVSIESYKTWLSSKTSESRPPRIQSDLKQAQWMIREEQISLDQEPTDVVCGSNISKMLGSEGAASS